MREARCRLYTATHDDGRARGGQAIRARGNADGARRVAALDEGERHAVIRAPARRLIRIVVARIAVARGEKAARAGDIERDALRCVRHHRAVRVDDFHRDVRDVVHGRPVANRDALANPEALELFRDLAELRD